MIACYIEALISIKQQYTTFTVIKAAYMHLYIKKQKGRESHNLVQSLE